VPGAPPPPPPSNLVLAGMASQKLILLPTYSVRVEPDLDWRAAIGPLRDVPRSLDAEIVAALEERGVAKTWTMPAALVASYKRNSTYATDPYLLAEEPLRAPRLEIGQRLPEPLASQLRTMAALHDEGRLVLAPVELKFERAGPTAGRGVLKVVLLDVRASTVSWFGEVKGDSTAAYGPRVVAEIASRFADMVGLKR
jgi:hypothetical protein